MKISCKVILFFASMLLVGVINTSAESVPITNARLLGYGVTSTIVNGVKQEVVIIKVNDGQDRYVAYVINGSPYGDYIFNILTNPAVWGENVKRLDITYDNQKCLVTEGTEGTIKYYEIQRFFLH